MQQDLNFQLPSSRSEHIPTVSIGMPVFNGEKSIRKALDSLLMQTFPDFELIISDNASTDNTGIICQEYAQRDKRIRYILQSKNKGAVINFKFVLDQARGPFFMWASCDDVKSPNFIQVNLDFLRQNMDFVASTSPVRFDGGEFDEINMGDASLSGEKSQRIIDFFRGWHANGRFYSLMRSDAIKDCFSVNEHFLGSDWAIILELAVKGKLNRVSEGWVVLGRQGASQSRDIFRTFRESWLNFFYPFDRLSQITWGLSKNFSSADKSKIALALLKMNMHAIVMQFIVLFRFGYAHTL